MAVGDLVSRDDRVGIANRLTRGSGATGECDSMAFRVTSSRFFSELMLGFPFGVARRSGPPALGLNLGHKEGFASG